MNPLRLLLFLMLLIPVLVCADNFHSYWTPINPLPATLTNHSLNTVATNSSGSTYVMAGDNGAIWSSPDGISWQGHSSGISLDFTDVIWNSVNNEFAAIANRKVLQQYDTTLFTTSSDGVTWTAPVVINGIRLRSMAHDNSGRYVAVGDSGAAATSTDGINWTTLTIPYDYRKALNDIIWANGQFVIVGGSAQPFGLVMTSTDGINWTTSNALTFAGIILEAIAWDGTNQYIAVGDGGYYVSGVYNAGTSSIDWAAPAATGGNERFKSISYSPALSSFVAVGSNSTVYSYDGSTWTAASTPLAQQEWLHDVVWNGIDNQFIASGTTALLRSTDGLIWNAVSSGPTDDWSGMGWNGTQFLSISSSGAVGTSNNGFEWAYATSTTTGINALTWNGSQYVAIRNGSDIIISTDGIGITWNTATPLATGVATGLNGIHWNGLLYIAVGNGGIIWSSPNGISWTAQTSPTSDHLYGVTWNDVLNQFLAVGATGTVLASSDGINWSTVFASATDFNSSFFDITSANLLDVTWNGFQYVAVGASGRIFRSSDGQRWVYPLPLDTVDDMTGIAWNGTRYAATGTRGVILSSSGTDLDLFTSYTESNLATANDMSGFTYTYRVANNGDFTATGVLLDVTVETSVNLYQAYPTSSSPSSCNPITAGDKTVTCQVPYLNPGDIATFEVRVGPTITGWMTTTATVSSNEPEAVLSDNILSLITAVQSMADKLDKQYVANLDSGSGSITPWGLLLLLALLPMQRLRS